MASSTAIAAPAQTTYAYKIDNEVERLKEYTVNAYGNFTNEADLDLLINELGYIRDRADQLQNSALGVVSALQSI